MTLKSRLIRLEDRSRPPQWPEVKLHLVAEDARLSPSNPLPDRHFATVHAGSSEKPGFIEWHETNDE